MTLCRHLRWKGYHGAARTDFASLLPHPSSHHSPCTCMSTGQPWGPDGAAASVKACRSGRTCYAAPRPQPGLVSWLKRLTGLETT